MSLLNPSPGEIADRLGILRRKILEADLRRASCAHWCEEYEKLWDALIAHDDIAKFPSEDVETKRLFWYLFLQLFAVNAALWELEADIREDSPHDSHSVWVLARQTKLNDERARLIHEIDKIFDPNAPREKLYGS